MSSVDRLIGWLRAVKGAASSRRAIKIHEVELRRLRESLDKFEQSLGNSSAETAALRELVRREFGQLTRRVDEALALGEPVEALESSVKQLTTTQEQLSASVSSLAPPFPALARAGDNDSATWLDAAFEETFRGTRNELRQRLAVYLPDVREAIAATGLLQVVDVGCGRGEWLELMRTEGIAARGVDQNRFIVNQCCELGFNVLQADAMKVLANEPARSLAVVTAFHLIEHLRLADQLQLMVAAFRALAPAGLFVLETPNPENLIVGAWTFYMDPSHQRPLPPTLLRFLLEAAGFEIVAVRRLHADDGLSERAVQEGWPAGVRELLCGPRDFGVIARRPAS